MWTNAVSCVAVCSFLLCFVSVAAPSDEAAIADLQAGLRTEANAAWWGFDSADATAALQAAIDSGAPRVFVPDMGTPWVIRPVVLRSNLEIVFESGAVVMAKPGEFKGGGDSLFSAVNVDNLRILGNGATLRMNKRDYQGKDYTPAEWRMTLDLSGCNNVRIEWLRLESSGGDGIYLGATAERPGCRDVTIRNVACIGHHRQGISVIGAENLLIESCVMSGTSGTAPEAGIDFEPNEAREGLVNCVVRDCLFSDNQGAGMLVYLKNLNADSLPVSILFENCRVYGGRDQGMAVGAVSPGVRGTVEFRACTVENTGNGGAFIYDKSPDGALVRFKDCIWRDVAARDPRGTPILITLMREAITPTHGGIVFEGCALFDTRNRPSVVIEEDEGTPGIIGLEGDITVRGPGEPRVELRQKSVVTGLQLVKP